MKRARWLADRVSLAGLAALLPITAAWAVDSWTAQTSPTTETLRWTSFLDDDTGWAVGNAGVIFKTVNGGANWAPQTSGITANERLTAIRFVDANVGWAGAGQRVLRSANGGTNWTVMTGIDTSALVFRNSIFPVSANVAWSPASCNTPMVCGPFRWFYRYTFVSGSTVSEEVLEQVGSTAPLLRMYFVDADNGWAVGTGGVIRRITSASAVSPTFGFQTTCAPGLTLNGIFMLDANTGWIVGNTGTICATTNGGTNWNPQNSGTSAVLRSVSFRDALTGWVVGDGGLVLFTVDGGANWNPENSTVTAQLASVDAKATTVHAVGGDLAATSGNSTVLLRAGPPNTVFEDGFEDLPPP